MSGHSRDSWKRERKKIEEDLKLTRFSVDHASVSAFLVNSDAKILYVNEQACNSLGYTRQELLSMAIPDLDPHFPASEWGYHWTQLKNEGSLRFETLHRRKDGTLLPVEISANYVAFGGREYSWGFAQDISERKKAAEEVRRANRQKELILESAGDGIFGMNSRGNHILVNRAALKMLGYTSEDLMDRHSHSIWHHTRADGAPYPESECKIYKTARDGISRHVDDEVFWTREGSPVPVEYITTPIYEATGIVGTVVTFRDIRERKRAEEERERLVAELERSNRELEQFAYAASHDLQEPLRMVSSYVQLLARKYKGQLDDQADKYIAFSVDGANRMQKLIEGLLTFSRITSRGGRFGPVDANAVFAGAVANLATAISESRATVTKEDLPVVFGDEIQLMQLLQNLIGNAIKFRKPGILPLVQVSAAKKGEDWIFSVRDNGIGIEPRFHDRIFQIFQRLHSREDYPGTGIGLALCRRIVERHHGRIWIDSVPGQGTAFFFAIPAVPAERRDGPL
jgi:PAS domain S-box-containing protein